MTAIHIADTETEAVTKRLAEVLNTTVTLAVRDAVTKMLKDVAGEEPPQPKGGWKATFLARLYKEAQDYVQLRREKLGHRTGSAMFRMIARWRDNPVELARRLVMHGPTEGLRFLAKQERLELAAEQAIIDFAEHMPKDVVAAARANLDWAAKFSETD